MKKQVKLLVLFAMILAMAAMTMMLVSAELATELNDTHYYQVFDTESNSVGYADTLANAYADTQAGYTIKVLKNATEAASLTIDHDITIVSSGNGLKAITFEALNAEGQMAKIPAFILNNEPAADTPNARVALTIEKLSINSNAAFTVNANAVLQLKDSKVTNNVGTAAFLHKGYAEITVENTEFDTKQVWVSQTTTTEGGFARFSGCKFESSEDKETFVVEGFGTEYKFTDCEATSAGGFITSNKGGVHIQINGTSTITTVASAITFPSGSDGISIAKGNGNNVTIGTAGKVDSVTITSSAGLGIQMRGYYTKLTVFRGTSITASSYAIGQYGRQSDIILRGGTYESTGNHVIYSYEGRNSTWDIGGATYPTIFKTNNQAFFQSRTTTNSTPAKVELTNVTIDLNGESAAVLGSNAITNSIFANFTITDCTLNVLNDASLPTYDATYSAQWAGFKFYIPVPAGVVTITEDEVISNLEAANQIAAEQLLTGEYDAFFKPGVNLFVYGFAPFVVNSGATLTIEGGEYVLDTEFATVSGVLVIEGGSFKTTAEALFYLEGAYAEMKITGGTFNADGSFVSCENAPVITISGGTYIANSLIDAASDAEITVNSGLFIVTAENLEKVFCSDTELKGGVVVAKQGTLIDGIVLNEYSADIKYAGVTYKVWVKNGATAAGKAPVMDEVAELYLSEANSGIRFHTTVAGSVIDALEADGYTVKGYGTVIAPADYVAKAGAFTMEALNNISVNGKPYEKIAAAKTLIDNSATGGDVSFSGALVGLKSYKRAYAAVSYIEVVKDEVTSYFYSAYDSTENAYTAQQIAKAIVEDGKFEEDYAEWEKEIIRAYASGNIVTE